jgi:hypothetical protein
LIAWSCLLIRTDRCLPAIAILAVLAAAGACAHAPDAGAQDTDALSRCAGDGGAFIPANLEEAIAEVLRDSKPEELEKFKQYGPHAYHHGFGTSLRNCWGLWGGKSPLAKWFQARDIWHPDDMSGIVLESLHRRLLGQPIDPASAWNSVHEQGIERGLAAGILRRVDETWVAYRALALPRLWFQDGPGVIAATLGSGSGEPGGGPPV